MKEFRPPVKFYWRGNHHSYYGVWFIAFGFFNIFMGWDNINELMPLWYSIIGIGAFMIADDMWEHKISADTPLRILWERIYAVIKK